MADSIGEVVFNDLPALFTTIVDTFSKVVSWFTVSIGEWFTNVSVDLEFPQWLIDLINGYVEDHQVIGYIWNVPLLALMLGSALGMYMVYQLITWLLNVVT